MDVNFNDRYYYLIKRLIDNTLTYNECEELAQFNLLMISPYNDVVHEKHSVDKVFKYLFHNNDKWECDKSHYVKEIYNLLGWNNLGSEINGSDTINSFWITCRSAIINADFDNDYFFIENNPMMRIYNFNAKEYSNSTFFKKETYINKYLKNMYASPGFYKIADKVKDNEFIKEFCKNVYTLGNFMPCPTFRYNKAKGYFVGVNDYFSLFVDKIQECIDKNECIDANTEVTIKEIKQWHNFLLQHREVLLLEDYYDIVDNKLIGKPLFKKQTLDYPLPQTEDEIKECLANIITRIRTRGTAMLKKIINEI